MEGTIAEIRLFAPNFAPRNWSYCAGQTLAISSNTALFSLIGTMYGGNGTSTFQLPDLRGRVPVGSGNSHTGVTSYELGETAGTATQTAVLANLPAHIHNGTLSYALPAFSDQGESGVPTGASLAALPGLYTSENYDSLMETASAHLTIANNGNNAAMPIMQPYLSINYIICVQGLFPSRN